MTAALPPWDGQDLAALLQLAPVAKGVFENRFGEANSHGRVYGGQLLGQALQAAAQGVAPDRLPTLLQFLFLQGAQADRPIAMTVTPLQDGKRFVSRHVRGQQGAGRLIFDAQVSFAQPLPAPAHGRAPAFDSIDPATLLAAEDLPLDTRQAVEAAFGYPMSAHPMIDFRVVAPTPRLALSAAEPRQRFWSRLRRPLPDDAAPALLASAFAYLSDWWLNYTAIGAHQAQALAQGGLYVASLNHAIWFHRPLRPDEWLHFDCSSPAAGAGRGLTVAQVHDRAGRLVASATQECLMAAMAGAAPAQP